jgi:hypothetical protein
MKSFSEAKWIWHNSYRGTNVYVNFEDEFTLGDAPSACSIKISCDRNYALYINGGFVDSGQYSDYEDLKYYDELDITPHVKPGKKYTACRRLLSGRKLLYLPARRAGADFRGVGRRRGGLRLVRADSRI